ncbi:glycosyltransferase [Sneathiella aquimaris]|uniref:glycosyltransferase n=1 Tax=Sneathiella aquimaris TaxID=2599305 RepID=UPI00146A8327|nr:glycosyltransferase [Sneathiella aquimaris]
MTMRVLYVGNFNEKANGGLFYDSNRKLANGFIRNGHQVYQFSDRDIARSSSWFESRKFGILPANKRLFETAQNFWPDLIIIGHSQQIFTKTLKKIKKALPHVKIIVRNVDAIWHQDNVDRIMSRVDVVDAVFITTAGEKLRQFARKNNVVSFFPNVMDKTVDSGQSFNNPDPEYRLFYGMGNAREGTERHQVASRLLNHFPEGSTKILGINGVPPVNGITYQNLIANARMGLNLSQGEGLDDPYYSSDRMAHYMGNGLMTLIHRRTQFDKIFKDEEMAFYEDFDDLIKKIEYFNLHDDEAREIAQKGWQRSHEIFDAQRVAKYLVEVTFREPLSEEYDWPTELFTV